MTQSSPPIFQPADGASRPRVVVAGVGLLTPIGHAAWANFTALLAGQSLTDRAHRLADHIDPVNLVRALGGVNVAQHASTDPAVELAERAAREAALEAGIELRGVPMHLGTSKGAVHALTRCAEAGPRVWGPGSRAESFAPVSSSSRDPRPETPDPSPYVLGPHGYLTHHLHQRLGVIPRRHHVAACASSLTALHHARHDLMHHHARDDARGDASDYALVATADAALLPQFVHSYRRLGVLAPLTPNEYRQRPLDGRRAGFMLTECGAAILLKRLSPGAAPAPGQIELLDTATATEAYDTVRTAPHMPALQHVAEQLLTDRLIDVIHPHAPGTTDHDPAELTIYRDVLGARVQRPEVRGQSSEVRDQRSAANNARSEQVGERRAGSAGAAPPDLYACKGALGHSLGAAGLTALILACLSLHAGQRPPMPWIDQPLQLPGIKVRPDAQPCPRTGAHAVFAAGFGGHTAGAVVQRHG